MSAPTMLDSSALRRALSIPDLTDPGEGPHAIQILIERVLDALRAAWGCEVRMIRRSAIVTAADNYDRLHYPPEGVARDARYTRYVNDGVLLRTQTSAMIPGALRALAADRERRGDVLIACPGIVYRRDQIDRMHTGEPHQLDLWRIRRGAKLDSGDLLEMIAVVVESLLPGRAWRTVGAQHPYTLGGLQVDVAGASRDEWIEIGECGLALPAILTESGLPEENTTGLAMGLGLDRLLMLAKTVDDIRCLRATDPRVASQMLDLTRYRPVSSMPPVARDLSIVVDEVPTNEDIGDRVREALEVDAELVEEVAILSVTPYDALPAPAAQRLGIHEGQSNVLLRVVLRAVDRTLTHAECNTLRDRIYAACHRGTTWHWASVPA